MCALSFLADGIFPERENSGYVIRLGLLKLYLLYVFIFLSFSEDGRSRCFCTSGDRGHAGLSGIPDSCPPASCDSQTAEGYMTAPVSELPPPAPGMETSQEHVQSVQRRMDPVREGLTKEGEPRYTGKAALPFAYRRRVRNWR